MENGRFFEVHKCHETEDYEHIFYKLYKCPTVFVEIMSVFKKCGIDINIKNLKTLVVGYNLTHTDYVYVNIALTIVGF